MPARPEIFISAASRDLRTCRQLVRDALLTLGCVPIVQDHFPPGEGEVRAMLRARIAGCQAVIHLAGECYGHEPQERDPAQARRSYTQMEYDIARELKKPLYTFLCAESFPYDAHEPEAQELRALQQAHRAALAAGDNLYVPLRDPQELGLRVRELQTRVEGLSRELQRTRSWLGRGVAVGLAALVIIAAVLFGLHQRATRTENKVAEVTSELDRYRAAVKALADNYGKDIEPGRKLSEEEKFARALEVVATQQKVGVGELKTWLALFVTQVRANPGADFYDRALADFAEKHFADAATNASKAADQYHEQREAAEKMAASATERAGQARENERRALSLVGDAEAAAGHYAKAIDPYERTLALIDENKEPLPWCIAAQNYGIALYRMGRYADAEPLARKVIDKRTALLGAENPETLRSYNHLANVLYFKGDLPGAEAIYRRCLEVQERTLGKENTDTLRTLNHLANALYGKGNLTEAEALYRRCLEAQERTLGKEDPDTLATVINLANVLNAKGDSAGAEALCRRCLEVQERTLGPEHPTTLLTVINLANALLAEGKLPEAEALYRRAYEAQERTLGKEHPTTLLSLNNLAETLQNEGKFTEAEPLFRRCLEATERTLGKEHPFTLACVNNLGESLKSEGNLTEAEALDRRCLEATERTLGKDHSYTLAAVNSLAGCLEAKGDLAGAEALYRRGLEARERTLGKVHPDTASTASLLAECLDKEGKTAQALPLAEEAVAGVASLPKDNADRLKYEKALQDLRAKLANASPSR